MSARPFADFTAADFETLDARLLDEVIEAACAYSRTRDWNATTAAEARAANDGLERARKIVGFLTTPYAFRRYMGEALGCADSTVLCADNGFRPHNAASCEPMAALMRERLPAAIARARGSEPVFT